MLRQLPFPCNGFNRVSRVATGASPSQPVDDGRYRSTALTYDTTYYAQATQGTQTSSVFTFHSDTDLHRLAVALANGGTAKKVDSE